MKRTLKKIVSPETAIMVRKVIGRTLYRGDTHLCPVCGNRSSRFMSRPNQGKIMCPVCRSLQRHRLLIRYWQEKTNLLEAPKKRLLHIAPEPCFYELFRTNPAIEYTSADIDSIWAQQQADITDLPFSSESFDVIICNHVLEHVLDDRKAMSEFFRVLVPGGWATLLVPIKLETTYEDESIVSPEDRLRVFGQYDHVRIYGKDYFDRLKEAGFIVESIRADALLHADEITDMVLDGVEDIIIARKAVT